MGEGVELKIAERLGSFGYVSLFTDGKLLWSSPLAAVTGYGEVKVTMVVSWRGALRVHQERCLDRSRERRGHAQTEMTRK